MWYFGGSSKLCDIQESVASNTTRWNPLKSSGFSRKSEDLCCVVRGKLQSGRALTVAVQGMSG